MDSNSFFISIKLTLILKWVEELIGFDLNDVVEGYCWTRTSERQTATLRVTYLKAVLRQEVGYFDLKFTNSSQVISSDSLIIQDFISEKVCYLFSLHSSVNPFLFFPVIFHISAIQKFIISFFWAEEFIY